MPVKDNIKFVGLILFVIGFALIIVNYSLPHTFQVEKSVEVPHQVIVPREHEIAASGSHILESNQNWLYANISVKAGQTFKMTWSADTSILGYIFTNNQYNNYHSSIFSNVNCQASGSGKTGTLTYNVQDSDNYVALLHNTASFTGTSAQIYSFKISSIAYNTETQYVTEAQMVEQKDNLYLFLGFPLILLGIMMFSYFYNREYKSKKLLIQGPKPQI